MIRIMRRYQKGVLGVLAILFISLAMAGFGVDMFLSGGERKAITVNDDSVSYVDYHRELRQTRDRYVQMFGARFNELAKSFNLNLPRQVVDQMINGLLIEQQAKQLGLVVGNEELKSFLNKSFEGDTGQYANFLRSSGYSAAQFEQRMKSQDLLREQYESLLKLVSFSTRKEAEALLKKDETSIDFRYVQVSTEQAMNSVPVPSDEQLKLYLENNTTDFQTPATAEYEYVMLTPESVSQEVAITDEDIAYYLSENEARFSTPERAKIRHIELLFPKDSNAAQQKETKERAEAILKRAQANEPFEALVMEASDDITTKMIGGDAGWLEKKDDDLSKKVFALKKQGIADLVSTSSGYKIVKVDEYVPAKLKELSEVRGEIEKALRKQEAPAYAAARAQELFTQLQSGKTTLAQIAETYKTSVIKSGAALPADKDPSDKVKGLTAQVIETGNQKLQLQELGDKSVLVSLVAYNEPSLPAFDQLRDKIITTLKKREAATEAQKIARDLLAQIKAGKDLKTVATEAKLTLETKEKVTRKSPATDALSDPALMNALFNDAPVGKPISEVFKGNQGFLIAEVIKVTPPSEKDIAEKLPSFQEQASTSVSSTLTNSLLNHLKAVGKVDFDQTILTD